MKPKFVQVTWIDAWLDDSNFVTQHAVSQTHGPLTVRTRGWLLVDDELGISIAAEDSEQDGMPTYRHRHFIPRVNVVQVEELRFARPRRPRSQAEAEPGPAKPS